MANKPLKISEEAAVQMPMKTVASLITMVAIGTWAYFGLHETLNSHSTQLELISKDLEQNTEFRIKYPRGQLGKSSGEAELYMLVEDLYKSVDRLNKAIEDGMHNKVNIEFFQKQVEKATNDIEKLKDRQREFANGRAEVLEKKKVECTMVNLVCLMTYIEEDGTKFLVVLKVLL